MKLAVIGGGGVRAPLLAKSIALGAAQAGITEVVLMDTHPQRLATYGKIAQQVVRQLAPFLPCEVTTDAEYALTGAHCVITTIRPGAEQSRAFDERTCVNNGVLGQETTGAGGFAMALRSIPAIAAYCALAKRVAAPGAVVLNFTNPSGLVTQAMHDLGYHNVFGVCDAPTGLYGQLEKILGAAPGSLSARCYGLNHLSWFDNFICEGRDVTDKILTHPQLYTHTDAKLFGKDLVELLGGALPNEYLYFYYARLQAVGLITAAEKTRGEEIAAINARMDTALAALDLETQFAQAFACYMAHLMERENSYFAIETGETQREFPVPTWQQFLAAPDSGGYAGVALRFLRAKTMGETVRMVLSVPNNGTLPFLRDTDVVEVTCELGPNGYRTLPVRGIAYEQQLLIQTVKQYETLAVQAILQKDASLAVKALCVHPLVGDYDTAVCLVDTFLKAYTPQEA